ncbi:MAG: four helix bundle protein [Minisyncoccales bacterium]
MKYNRNTIENKSYITIDKLDVYQLSRQLSRLSWCVYNSLTWQDKKIIGDQFIRSADSVGANIVEGYSRFHYLDKIKFYYNSRASLSECADHWLELLIERKLIDNKNYTELKIISKNLSIKLNNFISSTYNSKRKE